MKHRIILATVWIAVSASAISQTTRLVPSQYPTIQAAINASVNGDSIVVAPGTYSGASNFTGKTLSLTSTGGSSVTTLLGTAGAAVVTFQGGEGSGTILHGFRIQNGSPGIYCHNASPQIMNCVVANNVAQFGNNQAAGGLRCLIDAGSGSPTISNCVFSNNTGFRGGAMSFETAGAGASAPAVFGCTISNNIAQLENGNGNSNNGGGIYLAGTVQLTVLQSVLENNVAGTLGGAILSNALSLLVQGCRITGNHALVTSAVTGNSVSIVGSLIAGNHTSGINQGGTLDLGPGSSLNLCTITGNTTNTVVGGVVISSGGVPIANSIIWGNDNVDVSVGPAGVSATYCDIGVANFVIGGTNLAVDPLFIDAAGDDYHLATASPCRNAGTPSALGLPPNDLDGTPRFVGSAVDIGVDEVPALVYGGTMDGLDLYARINGAGDPLASTRAGVAGDPLTVRMASPSGTLVGGLPLFAVRLYTTGFPFMQPPGTPWIWLDGQAIIAYGVLSAPPFGFPGLPADGLEFAFTVPFGLAGKTVRMQGLVSSINALNFAYATSNATEVTF